MPILNITLVEGQQEQAQIDALMLRCSEFYAELLGAPIERVRVFVNVLPIGQACIGGVLSSAGAPTAPFFSGLALEGRPIEDRHGILTGITDLLVEIIGCDRAWVRGMVHVVNPENWGIAGVPASVARKAEIDARAAAARLGESSP